MSWEIPLLGEFPVACATVEALNILNRSGATRNYQLSTINYPLKKEPGFRLFLLFVIFSIFGKILEGLGLNLNLVVIVGFFERLNICAVHNRLKVLAVHLLVLDEVSGNLVQLVDVCAK